VLAPRLIRTLCNCTAPSAVSAVVLKGLTVYAKTATLYRAKGCEDCKQTGYRGRAGIYEMMAATNPLRELLLKKASSRELSEMAVKDGMVTLRKAGVAKALQGLTTVEEVLRVTEHDFDE
jgi:type II secretory ATPase GspE/PulE/Tfp pilus assembly ATPase PilB-like protein